MSMSDYLEKKILDHILTATAYTSPNATLHLALFTADPTDANVTAGEVDATADDTAYARQTIAFDAADATAGTSVSNTAQTFAAVVYGTNAADYDITHFAIYDALTGGNLLHHAALTAPITRALGKSLVFDIGNITVIQG